MKRKVLLFLTVCLVFIMSLPVGASVPEDEMLIDTAELLSSSQRDEITDRIEELSDTYDTDIIIVLLDDYKTEYQEYYNYTDMSDPFNFIEEYYYQMGYNTDDGVALLVSMEERDWAFCRFGKVQDAVDDDYGYYYITDAFKERLSGGNYYEACVNYLDNLEIFLEANEKGKPYSESHTVKDPGQVRSYFLAVLGGSAVLAIVIVLVMKSGMNTAKPQPGARQYVKDGSFQLKGQQDLYLYSHTTKTAIPKDSGSGSSGRSGGGSHSGSHGGRGGSGKF